MGCGPVDTPGTGGFVFNADTPTWAGWGDWRLGIPFLLILCYHEKVSPVRHQPVRCDRNEGNLGNTCTATTSSPSSIGGGCSLSNQLIYLFFKVQLNHTSRDLNLLDRMFGRFHPLHPELTKKAEAHKCLCLILKFYCTDVLLSRREHLK